MEETQPFWLTGGSVGTLFMKDTPTIFNICDMIEMIKWDNVSRDLEFCLENDQNDEVGP
jgi:hypothetical protein